MEFDPPPPLKPQKFMKGDEPCWCESGKSWKLCHKDRHLQKSIPAGKLFKEMLDIKKRGKCLHPEASEKTCSNKIIKAHSVQRAGGLSAISDNGHVISVQRGFESIHKNNGHIIPEPIGIRVASTFTGFCSLHDNNLFKPIENDSFSLNQEAAFLLAFRALAYEHLAKWHAIKSNEIQRQADKGTDFDRQVIVQNYLHNILAGQKRGMKDVLEWKTEYDRIFIEKDYTSMPHYAVEFKGILPFVCSGGFHPEVDFNGDRLQIISRGDISFEHVCVNVSVIGERSFLAFGWHGAADGPAEKFVKSFKAQKNEEKANSALTLAVEQSENTYLRPSWWNELSNPHKNHLVRRMKSGMGNEAERAEGTYKNLVKILPDIEIVNEIGSI